MFHQECLVYNLDLTVLPTDHNMPAPDGNQFRIHLYHGTSQRAAEKIKQEGLKPNPVYQPERDHVYLTSDHALAQRYAANYPDKAILKFAVNPRDLRVDLNSFRIPFPYSGSSSRGYDESKLKDSETDWKNSLRQTGAVRHIGAIDPKNIVGTEEL